MVVAKHGSARFNSDTMDIIINTQNIVDDIGGRFLMELKSADPIPPKGVVIQELNQANARLTAILGRFLEPCCLQCADDSLAIGDTLVYKLILSSRKSANKVQPMTDLIHSFLVNSVLAKSYSTMGQAELASLHEANSVSDAQVISQLLHSKTPPAI